jgi:hypothetical protein
LRGGPDALHTNTLGPSCTCPVVVAAGGAAGVTRAASCLGSLTFTAALVAAHPMISMRMEARLEWLSFFATRSMAHASETRTSNEGRPVLAPPAPRAPRPGASNRSRPVSRSQLSLDLSRDQDKSLHLHWDPRCRGRGRGAARVQGRKGARSRGSRLARYPPTMGPQTLPPTALSGINVNVDC